MKKLFVGSVMVMLVSAVSITSVFAAGVGRGKCFADNHHDGICDYAGTACCYIDLNGDGICDKSRINAAQDADGDGICDHISGKQWQKGIGKENTIRGRYAK